jgi:hypothetical protein
MIKADDGANHDRGDDTGDSHAVSRFMSVSADECPRVM